MEINILICGGHLFDNLPIDSSYEINIISSRPKVFNHRTKNTVVDKSKIYELLNIEDNNYPDIYIWISGWLLTLPLHKGTQDYFSKSTQIGIIVNNLPCIFSNIKFDIMIHPDYRVDLNYISGTKNIFIRSSGSNGDTRKIMIDNIETTYPTTNLNLSFKLILKDELIKTINCLMVSNQTYSKENIQSQNENLAKIKSLEEQLLEAQNLVIEFKALNRDLEQCNRIHIIDMAISSLIIDKYESLVYDLYIKKDRSSIEDSHKQIKEIQGLKYRLNSLL